jgi:antitoxin VapB
MSLNIKDPEAHKLAQELAKATGETMTEAVTVALKERIARIRRSRKADATAAEWLAIGKRCGEQLQGLPMDHGSLLYDDQGLPK